MKQLLILSMLLPSIIYSQENVRGVKFIKGISWEQAKAKAFREGKYVFVDVVASWCGPCKMMEKSVYPNDSLGDYINEKFISIKVQMDTSDQDNEYVKMWYADAHNIAKEYAIQEYPTFLFFSSTGQLIFKDIGYKNIADFLSITKKAIEPTNLLYYSLVQEYMSGNKDYCQLRELAIKTNDFGNDTLAKRMAKDYLDNVDERQLLTVENIYFVRDVAKDRDLAKMLARKFKESYLDKLPDEKLCTAEYIWFMNMFNYLIRSNDNFFKLCYHDAQGVDNVMKAKIADFLVAQTVSREEISDKIIKNGKAAFKEPNWKEFELAIKKKYHKLDAEALLLNYKIGYYRTYDVKWRVWAKYKDQAIKRDLPNLKSFDIYVRLNVSGAWDAFLYCSNRKVLRKAIEWINFCLKLDKKNKAAYLDTKANLLYKLGKIKMALKLEKNAVLISSNDQEILANFNKMKDGQPTWPGF